MQNDSGIMIIGLLFHSVARCVPAIDPLRLGGKAAAIVCIVFFNQPAFAGSLDWSPQEIELTARQGDREAIGLFHYTNTSTKSVKILRADSGCDCTEAVALRPEVAPGQSGDLKVVFTIGHRTGLQQKQITVWIDAPGEAPQSLGFKVRIPEPLSLSAKLLQWKLRGASDEKPVEISAVEPNRIISLKILRIEPLQAQARLEVLEDGLRYKLLAAPSDTSQTRTVSIMLSAELSGGTRQEISIFALVR